MKARAIYRGRERINEFKESKRTGKTTRTNEKKGRCKDIRMTKENRRWMRKLVFEGGGRETLRWEQQHGRGRGQGRVYQCWKRIMRTGTDGGRLRKKTKTCGSREKKRT